MQLADGGGARRLTRCGTATIGDVDGEAAALEFREGLGNHNRCMSQMLSRHDFGRRHDDGGLYTDGSIQE
jgi:hypothetical protein